ncbi:MAG TPA: hypothetical protein VGH22_21185 [Candidatus Binatia bacterium]
MTEQEQIELNGRIADALFGWDHKENGMWADPTGDEYKLPPNYSDNSGLVIGLEYKLRKRGFSMKFTWGPDRAVEYTLSKDGAVWKGVAETKSVAICLAIQGVLDANALPRQAPVAE